MSQITTYGLLRDLSSRSHQLDILNSKTVQAYIIQNYVVMASGQVKTLNLCNVISYDYVKMYKSQEHKKIKNNICMYLQVGSQNILYRFHDYNLS